MVRQSGNHRSDQRTDGNARFGQLFNRRQPARRLRCAWLQFSSQFAVEGSYRDEDQRGVQPGEPRQQIDVASDQLILGNNDDRILKFSEHFKTAPCELQPPLDGLIRISDTAYRDDLRLPLRRQQFAAKQLRSVLLHKDFCFEIQASGESEIFVIRPSEAVDATMFAAPIRINTRRKTHIRTVVVINDGPRVVFQQ